MNILCAGNSFAVDAHTYIHQIAESIGENINVHILYIGGCPVDLHWKNFLSKDKAYEFYVNGQRQTLDFYDFFYGLTYTKYDYITFQQRSGDSGDAKTFFPELTKLMEGIRGYSDATYLLHKTWSYAKDYSHSKYGSNPLDQDAMDRDIKDAYLQVSKKANIPYIIPSGEAVRLAREVYGDVLCRDGFHMSELGRTLLGILWVLYFTGKKDIDLSNFHPRGYTFSDSVGPIDEKELNKLKDIALKAIENNKGYNLYD